jgi:hypothetical protein
MQLSKETLSLIRNFSSINGSLMIKSGNKLSTISEGKNVMAEAVIGESFPQDFAIYDLNEFMNVVSLFPSTDLDFNEKYVIVSEGGDSRIKYFAAGEGIVKPAPSTIKFPSPEISFDLSSAQLAMIQKVSSALKTSDVSVVGDGSKMRVVVADKKNDTSNAYDTVVGETDQEFKANFKIENIKVMPGDYEVSISKKKISRFKNKNCELTYYIAVESDSTF